MQALGHSWQGSNVLICDPFAIFLYTYSICSGWKVSIKEKMNCWKRRILFKDGKISSFRFLQFQVEEINQREAGYFEKKKNVRKKGFYWWIVPLLPLAEEWGRCRTINLSHKAQEGNLLLHFSIGSQSKKLSKDPTKSWGRRSWFTVIIIQNLLLDFAIGGQFKKLIGHY